MTYDVEFYQKENGEVPVRDFLESLSPKLRAETFREIELLRDHGPDLREPHTKPIRGKDNKGIYELSLSSQRMCQECSTLLIMVVLSSCSRVL